ncbi:hypothetical protein SLUN_33090 [Streptomyces lunaelactis]|uniref:Secreted protein n=1 Tax=Streptomyces lunaelactis TaxID=1535768 RepID=A0A2R4TB22_9ACTN|nr:hypothetical protein [Streptomyces lunaelactis]AVZ76325.1 hypothetical protein SLUN_33090 [Streptomyces lunaelactis]NUK90063.1 hypothetical protein [Streptomyces lunaelactis]NUL07870.1 hypothetical protein [Streptomyces lunaelactis]
MRRSSLSRWGTAAALLAAVVAVAAWRTAAADPARGPQPDSGTTSSDERQSPDEVRDYWTPQRMKEARPAPMPEDD